RSARRALKGEFDVRLTTSAKYADTLLLASGSVFGRRCFPLPRALCRGGPARCLRSEDPDQRAVATLGYCRSSCDRRRWKTFGDRGGTVRKARRCGKGASGRDLGFRGEPGEGASG